MPCHSFGFCHVGEISGHGKLHAASKRLDQIAGEAGPVSSELVDDTDIRLKAAGHALPLDGMIQKTITVVEGHIERVDRFLFLAQEKVLAQTFKIAGPKKLCVLRLQTEDAVE